MTDPSRADTSQANRTALAISPHLDDAVFSAGGTLHRLAHAGWRVVVATVFTRSVPDPQGFALACQLDKGLAPDIDYMALRRDEDAAALDAIGATPIWLPFAEAPHRGYNSAPALFDEPLAADDVAAAVGLALRDLAERVAPTLLLLPQAIGGHVDHRAVIEAATTLPRTIPRLWWHDYPYVARATVKQPCAALFAALAPVAVTLDADNDAAKLEASGRYASQLGFQFGGRNGLRARLAACAGQERFAAEAGALELLDGDGAFAGVLTRVVRPPADDPAP